MERKIVKCEINSNDVASNLWVDYDDGRDDLLYQFKTGMQIDQSEFIGLTESEARNLLERKVQNMLDVLVAVKLLL